MAIDREALRGRWVHAHEFDSGNEMVFVASDSDLPPSRGRQRLELRAGGTASEEGPGEADRPRGALEARWKVTDDDDLVILSAEGGERWRARVVSAEPGRFVLDTSSLR